MLKRRRTVIICGSVVLALILYIGINVLLAAQRAATFPKYWQDRAAQPVPSNAIRLVAMGDSIMQAIGSTHPEEGIAGRIAEYIQSKTGRAVHVTKSVLEAQRSGRSSTSSFHKLISTRLTWLS
jgi:CHASE2 domain-containing sensor protein